MKHVYTPNRKNSSAFLLRTSVVLMGLMFAAPAVQADDDMDDMGPTGGASTATKDFDSRSGQNSGRSGSNSRGTNSRGSNSGDFNFGSGFGSNAGSKFGSRFGSRFGSKFNSSYSLVYVNEQASEPDEIPRGQAAFTNVLDARTLKVIKRVPVAEKPHHFYKVPNQNKAYLTHFGGTSHITVLDLLSNRVLTTIPTGDGPRHLTFSADGKRAWSANLDQNSVSYIDVQNDKTLWTSNVTSKPNYAEPANGYVFAANLGGSSLSVLDARSGQYITDVPTGKKPFNMSVSCDGRLVMSANAGSNDVSFVDTNNLTELARVSIMGPIATAQFDTKVNQRLNPRVSPDCKYLWVGNQAAGTFAVLDIAQRKMVGEVKSAEKGGGSDIIFFIKNGPAAGKALGTNRYSPFVTQINPQPPFNVIKRIPAGVGTHYVWLNADSTEAYVSSRIAGSFSVVDLGSMTEVARKGGFKPIDQAAVVTFTKETVTRSVSESGDAR